MATFKQLVHPDLVRGLQSLGISAPNSIQAKAIPLGLSGRDVLVCAQTGSGKTFTFLLPILQRLMEFSNTEGTVSAVILAPTHQLAQQVATVARGLLKRSKKAQQIQLHSDGGDQGAVTAVGCHLFVGTPTMLSKEILLPGSDSNIHMLAIDEADLLLCESQVHESYFDLLNQRRAAEEILTRAKSVQLFLAMAHLTDQREEELLARFPRIQQVGHTGVLVPTLRQCFHYFKGGEDAKIAKLLWILAEAEKEELEDQSGATLIFASSPSKVDHLQTLLASERPELKILRLHEECADTDVSECFRTGAAQVLVATDMSVRGLDFPLIRHVILYDVPVDSTAFVHCAGRTARSGNTGLVTCIVEAGNAQQTNFDGKAIHSLADGPQLCFQKYNI